MTYALTGTTYVLTGPAHVPAKVLASSNDAAVPDMVAQAFPCSAYFLTAFLHLPLGCRRPLRIVPLAKGQRRH